MGTKYTTESVSGYNATPPADDGTVSEANKVKWSTIKTKLSDAIKTALESMDSKLTTHFNTGPTALTTDTTLGASHHNKMIQVSGSGVTLTLSDAATLAAGWYCWIRNTDASNSVTIGRATGADTFNGTAANYTLRPNEAILVGVNAAADGFFTFSLALSDAQTVGGALTLNGALTIGETATMSSKALNEAKGSDIASDTTTDIGAATGNFVDVTGTTTITGLGTVQAGTRRVVRFTGALTLTHNATSLILPTAANITTAANDRAEFISLGSGNWICTNYMPASGAPLAAPSASQGSSLVYIGSGTASSSATLDFTTLSADYDVFVVELVNVTPATDAQNLVARMSVDGGSTFEAGASDYTSGASSGSAITLAASVSNNAGRGGVSGTIKIYGVHSTSVHKKVMISTASYDSTANVDINPAAYATGSATLLNNNVDAIRFLFGSGNIASGEIHLYGIKKA
jgi:hypothetical protein